MYIYLCTKIIVLYELSHVISKDLDGGATEADSRASAPVGPSVATSLEQIFVMIVTPCDQNVPKGYFSRAQEDN